MAFLTANNFLGHIFKNTDQKDICVYNVFKGESKAKHEEKFFVWVFLQKSKTHFFEGTK